MNDENNIGGGLRASPNFLGTAVPQLSLSQPSVADVFGKLSTRQYPGMDQQFFAPPPMPQADTGKMWGAGLGALAGMFDAMHANELAGKERAQLRNLRARSPLAKMADGGEVREPNFYNTYSRAEQEPSLMGFLKYIMAGKQLPWEIDSADWQRANPPAPVVQDATETLPARDVFGRGRVIDAADKYAAGGLSRYVQGGTAGQADKIPAMLSDGEFVMDADTVSALGDGNNAAGASALEQMRQNIRAHKRKAPINKIPPKAKKPEAYLKRGVK